MAVYIVTGKLGGGKSLVSVARIKEKIEGGCLVATNLNLTLDSMLGPMAKSCRVMRVPDKPTLQDLEAIGVGNPTYDEEKNGILVLDECGTWLNSRNWQDKTRKPVNDYFLHIRKLGWDLFLLVQDIKLLDSQAREALAEHTVFCRRMDRLHIPFVGALYKLLTGKALRLPRIHVAKVMYGDSENALMADRWVYRGNPLFACYDTKQLFLADYPHGVYSYLTPWHLIGRYRAPRDWRFFMRLTRIVWKRFKSPLALAVGALLGVALTASMAFASMYHDLQSQRDTLAAQIDALQVGEPVISDTDSAVPMDTVLTRLNQLKIVGSANVGSHRWYKFSGPAGEVDSTVLAQRGVQVQWRNECFARAFYDAQSVDIYCW